MSDVQMRVKSGQAGRPPRRQSRFGIILANELRGTLSHDMLPFWVLWVGLPVLVCLFEKRLVTRPTPHPALYEMVGDFLFLGFMVILMIDGRPLIEPLLASTVSRTDIVLARFAARGTVALLSVCALMTMYGVGGYVAEQLFVVAGMSFLTFIAIEMALRSQRTLVVHLLCRLAICTVVVFCNWPTTVHLFHFDEPHARTIMVVSCLLIIVCSLAIAVRNLDRGRGL